MSRPVRPIPPRPVRPAPRRPAPPRPAPPRPAPPRPAPQPLSVTGSEHECFVQPPLLPVLRRRAVPRLDVLLDGEAEDRLLHLRAHPAERPPILPHTPPLLDTTTAARQDESRSTHNTLLGHIYTATLP